MRDTKSQLHPPRQTRNLEVAPASLLSLKMLRNLVVVSRILAEQMKTRAYMDIYEGDTPHDVSRSEVLGWFYNPNTTPKDKERVVVCLHGTGQELH